MKMFRTRLAVSLLASCGVYLLPIAGPHMVFFGGGMVAASVGAAAEGKRPMGWALSELFLMFTIQAVVAAACYWSLGKRSWMRWFGMALAFACAQVAVQCGLGYAIPAFYLVGKETAEERTPWPVEAEFEGVDLFSPDPSTRSRFQDASKLLLRNHSQGHYRILSFPEGNSLTVPVRPDHFTVGLAGITPSGAYLYSVYDPPTGAYAWFRSDAADGEPVEETANLGVSAPASRHLLPSGRGIVWIEAGRGEPALLWTRIHGKDGFKERALVLEGSVWQSPSYVEAGPDGSFWLMMGLDGLVRYDVLGRKTETLKDLSGVPLWNQSFFQNAQGKVAWEMYRDAGPCRVAWKLGEKPARAIELPSGKAVSCATLSPDGRWVAVSTTTNLNIGRQRDSLIVYDATSGREAFRLYLPRYTRSEVWFAGNSYFAYTTVQGLKSAVVVRRIVDPGSSE